MMPARQIADSSQPLSQPARATTGAPPARSRHRLLGIVILAAVAAAVLVWRGFFLTSGPDNVLTLSGRIEGDSSAVAPKAALRMN